MPTVRHDDIRNELFGDLSENGRHQYEAFGAVHEAHQVTARLAELRQAANLSQRQAAKRAGVDQADLSRIESGQVMPFELEAELAGGSVELVTTDAELFGQVG